MSNDGMGASYEDENDPLAEKMRNNDLLDDE